MEFKTHRGCLRNVSVTSEYMVLQCFFLCGFGQTGTTSPMLKHVHACTVNVYVHTCMQPDLSQGHPGVEGSMFRGAALQGGGYLRQSLLHTTGCYGSSMHRTWRDTIHYQPSYTASHQRHWLTNYSSIRQPCATMQGFKSTKHNSRFHWFPWLLTENSNFSVKSGAFGCSKKLKSLGPHWHTVSCSCTEALNQSTPFHTLQHTVLWSWINQVKMN